MKNAILVFVFSIALFAGLKANSQSWQWAKGTSGIG